jgi:hypothetical protein
MPTLDIYAAYSIIPSNKQEMVVWDFDSRMGKA